MVLYTAIRTPLAQLGVRHNATVTNVLTLLLVKGKPRYAKNLRREAGRREHGTADHIRQRLTQC